MFFGPHKPWSKDKIAAWWLVLGAVIFAWAVWLLSAGAGFKIVLPVTAFVIGALVAGALIFGPSLVGGKPPPRWLMKSLPYLIWITIICQLLRLIITFASK